MERWEFEALRDAAAARVKAGEHRATVILFKGNGGGPGQKYYTEEQWAVPADAIGPWDLVRSKDFRQIRGGAVYVPDQEPWGFPHLIMPGAE